MTEKERSDLYKAIFVENEFGRQILDDLRSEFYDIPLFYAGHSRHEDVIWGEGRREVVSFILDYCTYEPREEDDA